MRRVLLILSLFCSLMLGFSTGALAKKTITFVNATKSTLKVKLIFSAHGCAGYLTIANGVRTVCGSKTFKVGPGKTVKHTYRYKWGTTYRRGRVYCKTRKSWGLITGKFKLSKTITRTAVNGCKAY